MSLSSTVYCSKVWPALICIICRAVRLGAPVCAEGAAVYSWCFFSSNLLLDPLQLRLHVLQLMSAVQRLLVLLLSVGTSTERGDEQPSELAKAANLHCTNLNINEVQTSVYVH